ncbi:MAG TPA: Kazal-type serine protease inhibitor domain-containing protein [Bacteroidales bacterium]|nr:Kazal-type serine protease inhibitor domain-containing protein [Bacteroidales bacterium]HRX96757.1 Kazal-type serine protease inhibitor domain-containing protein [Bacteroidales bacterium]
MFKISKAGVFVNYVLLLVTIAFAGCKTPCACPDIYAPVCGDNGRTYANPCEAMCDKVNYYDGECPAYGIGVVQITGDTTAGCNFLVKILNVSYKPDSLPAEFKEDDLFVSLKYRRLNQYEECEELNQTFQVIEIQEINSY